MLNEHIIRSGTTSACAENTLRGPILSKPTGNYLRVRGEYFIRVVGQPLLSELPPRARRIRYTFALLRIYNGTTSACAENTGRSTRSLLAGRNYLRVRGEYGEIDPFTPRG